jgi:hypothetical protein
VVSRVDAPLTAHRFHYEVCGLALASTAALTAPGLERLAGPAATDQVDVLVDWCGAAAPSWAEDDAPVGPQDETSRTLVEPTGGWLAVSPSSHPAGDWTRLRFGHAGHHVQFDVAPGAGRVIVTWTGCVLAVHASTLLFSTVMSYLLHCHDRIAFHAGLLAWRDAAFVLAGGRGAGKSTTAAALIGRGAVAVSDDIAALRAQGRGWVALPGLPGIRLTREARIALDVQQASAEPVWPRCGVDEPDFPKVDDKAVVELDATSDAGRRPLPVRGMFLLPPRSATPTAPRIGPVRPAEALPHLVEHLLTPAWIDQRLDEQRFTAMAELARGIPVRRVERPNTLDALPALCDAMLAELDKLCG